MFSRELLKAVRSATLLYNANFAVSVVLVRVLTLFIPYPVSGTVLSVLEVYSGAIAAYASIVYLVTRSRKSSRLGSHFYFLGLLGLAGSGVLCILGSVGFLSSGYWTRELGRTDGMRCARDRGQVVAFGEQSLVCKQCSRLVKIGLDLPRSWSYVGLVLLAAGIIAYALSAAFPSFALVVSSSLNVPFILGFDGVALLILPSYVQRTLLGGGYVRLPPDENPR